MIFFELLINGLTMKREQLRLASFIISIITINSLILYSFTNGPGRILIHLLTLFFVIIAEYLLTKQTIESSSQRISLFTQLGVQSKSIVSVIIARFLLFGIIGIISGLIIGVSIVFTLHLPIFPANFQNIFSGLIINSILSIVFLTILGICIGTYLGIFTYLRDTYSN